MQSKSDWYSALEVTSFFILHFNEITSFLVFWRYTAFILAYFPGKDNGVANAQGCFEKIFIESKGLWIDYPAKKYYNGFILPSPVGFIPASAYNHSKYLLCPFYKVYSAAQR